MSVVKLIYCMRAKANKARAEYYNAFKVHITTKVSRKSWHSALITYAAIENSRSFVKGEVAEEGDCCYRLAVKKKKRLDLSRYGSTGRLPTYLKNRLEAEGGIRGRVRGFRKIC